MARFTFLIPSTCGNKQLGSLFDYFLKLSSPYARIEVQKYGEEKLRDGSLADVQRGLEKESQKIVKHLRDDDLVFLLSEKGEVADTAKWSAEMSKWMHHPGRVVFILGSAHGLHDSLYELNGVRALAIGPMTMQHELALVVWSEQLYRLLTIQVGKRYHY